MDSNCAVPWDGSFLGSFSGEICLSWSTPAHIRERCYARFDLPQGTVYAMYRPWKNSFPLLIDHLRYFFGLPRRGMHLIEVDKKLYYLYRVPYLDPFLVYELPVSLLDSNHPWYCDPVFVQTMRETILVADFLALRQTIENRMWIRDQRTVVWNNDRETTLLQDEIYDYTIITPTLFRKWYGERAKIQGSSPNELTRFLIYRLTQENDPILALGWIRKRIEEIIMEVDKNYIWYASLIVERISRRLLHRPDGYRSPGPDQ